MSKFYIRRFKSNISLSSIHPLDEARNKESARIAVVSIKRKIFLRERERERDKWVSEEERTNIVPSLKNVPYDEVTDSLFFDDQEFPLIR